MKRKHGLLFIALAATFSSKAQVVLTEDFNAPFVPGSANTWTMVNNSAPVGNVSWFQGNAASSFAAYNGGPNDYFAANFNSTSASSGNGGTISNWLISPVVSLVNGARIEFATRTIATQTVFPDRMQVLICPTSTFNINGTGSSPFSVVFDINSTLSNATTASQNGSVVTGYPQGWTVYTATVAGITGTVNGRFAFRHFVTNGGSVGVNSNYIGLDAVKYSLPCAQPTMTVALSNTTGVCSGNTVGLTVGTSGTLSAVSYTWSTGLTGTQVAVTPSSTTTYTVMGESASGCIGTQTAVVTVTATPNLQVPSYTVCASPSVPFTLTATGATSYTWNTTSTVSSIVVNPTATTVYTVTATGGNTVCPTTRTSTITVGTDLSIELTASSTTICAGATVTLSAMSAGSTFSWSTGGTAPSITVNPSTTTTYSIGGVLGSLPSVCIGTNVINITVNQNPTLSVTQPSAVCSLANFTASASGADNYLFSLGQAVSNSNPATLTAPFTTSATTAQYMVTGTYSNGCSASGSFSFSLLPRPNITAASTKSIDCIGTVMTLTASGASTYTWSNNGGNNASASFTTGSTAGNVTYTVSGTSAAGCSANYEVIAFVSSCAGIGEAGSEAAVRVYPNPFSNELRISGSAGMRVELYNLLGQKLVAENLSESVFNFNTSELHSGVYVLKTFDVDGREVKSLRLIKH